MHVQRYTSVHSSPEVLHLVPYPFVQAHAPPSYQGPPGALTTPSGQLHDTHVQSYPYALPATRRVEPYMSSNQQHASLMPVSSEPVSWGQSGRSSSGSQSYQAYANAHTSTSVVAAGERYPCDLCDRSFTRLHDRRRHYETVHATSPVLHRCRYCRKEFVRADALKRHIDNGCDEMPQ